MPGNRFRVLHPDSDEFCLEGVSGLCQGKGYVLLGQLRCLLTSFVHLCSSSAIIHTLCVCVCVCVYTLIYLSVDLENICIGIGR